METVLKGWDQVTNIPEPPQPKNTLDVLLLAQSSTQGCWTDPSIFPPFLTNPDQSSLSSNPELSIILTTIQPDPTHIWLTLLALYILQH